MPELIQAYEDHSEHRDQFEIIAFHDSSLKSIEEIDEKTERIKEKYWSGKDLPFPILVDNNGKTEKLFGVQSHPTQILIDPEGNVVGESQIGLLEKELPRLPAITLWERARDMQTNVQFNWNSETTLDGLINYVARSTGTKVELEESFAKENGFDLETSPNVLISGYGISLRSHEQLMLEPMGLAVIPTDDGESLIIGKNPRSTEQNPSKRQLKYNKILRDRIANQTKESTQATEQKIPPLELEDVSLQDAVNKIAKHFSIPMAIDRKGMEKKEELVAGKIENNDLESSLNKMLDPLDLEIVVKYEVILVTPKE